jgi:hypothetical protein
MANDVTSKVILGLDPSEFRRGIQQVDAKLKETSKLFGNLGQAIGAAFAGGQIISFAQDAMRLGDELQKVSTGFARFGGEANLEQLRRSTRGLVTDLELMKRATAAGNFGIGIGEMGNLLAFATRRAQETGQEVDYLVESIITGIGRKSPLILDNLGISATHLRSKLNGVSVEAASVGEVSRAVGEIATEQLRLMGEAAVTATDKMARLRTSWENFKASTGVFLQDATLSFYDTFDKFFTYMKGGLYGMRDIVFEINGLITDQTILRARELQGALMPIGPGATEPNLPAGPPVLNFGNFSEQTLTNMRAQLELFNKELENVQIGSARFKQLQKQIEDTEYAIGRATGEIWDGAKQKISDLDTKGLTPLTHSYQYQNHVLQSSLIPTYDEFAKMIQGAKDQMELAALQMSLLNQIGAQFGNIFVSSFNAAMENGTNFFEELGKALKNYITQMAVAVGVTAALAAIMSTLVPNLSFGKAFKGIAGGTGLGSIFGEGGIIELVGTLKGFDMQLMNRRTDTFLRSTN